MEFSVGVGEADLLNSVGKMHIMSIKPRYFMNLCMIRKTR